MAEFIDPNRDATDKQLEVTITGERMAVAPTIAAPDRAFVDPNRIAYDGQLAKVQANPAVIPSLNKTREVSEEYGKAAGIGVVKGIGSILDFTIGPLMQDLGPVIAGKSLPTFSEKAEERLPESRKGGPKLTEKIIEGGTAGLISGAGGVIPSAVAAGVTYGTGNVWAGLAAGAVVGLKGNLRPNSLWGEANERLDLPGATLTEANPTNFKERYQAVLQGLPWAGNTMAKRAGERNTAFRGKVDEELSRLNAAENPTQAGLAIQTAAKGRVGQIKDELEYENALIQNMMVTPRVPYQPVLDAIKTIEGQITDLTTAGAALGSPSFRRFINAFKADIANKNLADMPVADARALRTRVGYELEDAIFGGERAMRTGEAKLLYGALSRSIKEAIPPPMRDQFDQSMARQAEYYSILEKTLAPLIKEVNPEMIWRGSQNQARLGATKLLDIRKEVEAVDPSMWETYAGYSLRKMGENNQGVFSMNTYSTNWNKMPDEVKQALFGNTQYGELPQLYQDLAITADRFKVANSKYNFSESGNVINTSTLLQKLIYGAEVLTATAAGGAHTLNFYGNMPASAGQVATGMAASVAMHYGVEKVLASMMTNPTLLKWAATDWSGRGSAIAMSTLRSLPGVTTETKEAVENYIKLSQQPTIKAEAKIPTILQPGETGKRGFAEGGSVNNYTDYEGEPISQDKWQSMQPSYEEGQKIPNQRLSVWELFKTEREAAPNKFEREEQLYNGIHNHPQEIELASGGSVEDTKKQITTVSEQKGVPSILSLVTAQIESNFGRSPDRAGSQYQGIYQMGHTEAREMGGRGIEHGVGLLARRKGELANKIGREPALWEIYLAHNQGVSGAASLLSNPNMSSGEAITKAGGRPINISSNFKGNPSASSLEFTEKVRNDFNRRAMQIGGSEEVAASVSSIGKLNNSATSVKNINNTHPTSIINMFVQSAPEEPQIDEIDPHEGIRTALLEGSDAPTQAAIKSILGAGNA